MEADQPKNKIDLEIREDGVYLVVEHPADCPKVSRMEVIALIDAYGVSGVDYVALNDALKDERESVDLKISSNTSVIQSAESAGIEISKDRMEAYITFSPPINKGRLLTVDDILALLEKNNVKTGDPEKIAMLLKMKRYEKQYVVAEGIKPVHGEDGSLKYHFDNSNLRPKPKIMDDGSVNFRQLGLIRLCNRGDVLITCIPEKEGANGTDVFGNSVPFVKGRAPMPMPKGKNTVVSEDGLHLIADASGQLVIADKKINISPCLEFKGNIDNSTGDVEFNGEVTIRGNVVSGFTVRATGNVEVMGVCEAAKIYSDGSIVLGNGAQGADKAELVAAGDITAKFIENCKVTAGGNILADSILNSTVKCDGEVILSGKNGFLVGGSLITGSKLTAKTIGSPMGTQTEVEAGSNPQALSAHRELSAEYEKMKENYDKYDKSITTLNEAKQKGILNEDKKNLLLKMINMKITIREKMNKLQTEIDELTQCLVVNTGTISAAKVVRPGVKITIGSASLTVRDEIQNCVFRNNGEKISIGPFV
ncbi:MAG: FapA family protein [Defluviitaleaceae bacterium]|nr:FapA family protein [Defluviitaleaceae bacterium]